MSRSPFVFRGVPADQDLFPRANPVGVRAGGRPVWPTSMSDVTIADFIAWEPRLVAAGAPPEAGAPVPLGLDRPVAWIVAARTGIPMLPALRGGEVVLLPERLLDALDTPLADLLADLARSGVGAAILPADRTLPWVGGAGPLELLHLHGTGAASDLESDLNRSLTELRGDLYRAGTGLSREISRVAASSGGADALLAAAASTLGMDLSIGTGAHDPTERWNVLSLSVGSEHVVTATVPDLRARALARLALRSLQAPLAEAVRRDEASRPRGVARAEALGRLMRRDLDVSAEQLARTLGLDASARYRVALVRGADPSAVARALGGAEDAGRSDDDAWLLIRADDSSRAAPIPAAVLARVDRAAGAGVTVAISAAVEGVASLPDGRDQALFVGDLQRRGLLRERVAPFDAVDRIGAFRFVHAALRDPDLVSLSTDALGALPREDRRRTLRDTLLVFLESGGSHALTSERLGIHRNTLAYRLRRIAELAGRDAADPGHRLTLHLAALIDAVRADGPAPR